MYDTNTFFKLQELKARWRGNKARAFRELNKDGYKTPNATYKALGYEHFMACFKLAWDNAFTKELNITR